MLEGEVQNEVGASGFFYRSKASCGGSVVTYLEGTATEGPHGRITI